MSYPVHEMFHTFQGEGVHMGKAAFFIRLFGCPLKCPWCDSAGTWHPAHVPKNVVRYEPNELAMFAKDSGAGIVVITGGEPCIHDLLPLVVNLRMGGMKIHVETSGAFPVPGVLDWVTVSPKNTSEETMHSLKCADEWKLIVDSPSVPEDWYYRVNMNSGLLNSKAVTRGNVWLHPEWSQRMDEGVLRAIIKAVKNAPDIFRAGYQMHKLYKVDTLDSRSRMPVPLGGNPKLGY